MENKKKHKKRIASIFTALFAIAIMIFCSIPTGAISGNFYTGDGSASLSYNTTNDLIRPLMDNHLVFFPSNGYMNNYYTSDMIINNNELIANNFKISEGSLSYDPLYPYVEDYSGTYPSANGKPTFSYRRGGTHTNVVCTPSVYKLTGSSENVNKSDLACLSILKKDKTSYHYLKPRGSDGTSYAYTLPQYMSVYAQDFYIVGEFFNDFRSDNGYFGYRLEEIDEDNAWLNGKYSFTIEYVNMETGEEYIYTKNGNVGNLRSTDGNYLRLPLFTIDSVDDLIESDTFGSATLIYVKNVYTNYDMGYSYQFEDSEKSFSYIWAYSGYIACNDTNIDGTDFNQTVEQGGSWNVAFTKELMPEIMASRQRYLTSFAHKDGQSYTNFVGNALKGVFEPKIFGTFGIGDVMGMLIAFGVVMGFLKYFAGG